MWRRLLIISIGLVLNIALRPILTTAQQNAHNKKPAQNKNQTASDNAAEPRRTAVNPSGSGAVTIQGPIRVINEPTVEEKQRQSEERLKPWWRKPEWIGILVGVLASIFAGFAFYAARRQANAAESQARDVTEQLQLMRRQFETCNRAFLDTDNWSMDLTLERLTAESVGTVVCHIKHFGNSPATIISIVVHLPIPRTETPNAMLYPGGPPHIFRFLIPIAAKDILGDKISVELTGTIRYNDGFSVRDKDFARIFERTKDGDNFIIPEGQHNNERIATLPVVMSAETKGQARERWRDELWINETTTLKT